MVSGVGRARRIRYSATVGGLLCSLSVRASAARSFVGLPAALPRGPTHRLVDDEEHDGSRWRRDGFDIQPCPTNKEAQLQLLHKIRKNWVANIVAFTAGGECCAAASLNSRGDLCFAVPAMLGTLVLWAGWSSECR